MKHIYLFILSLFTFSCNSYDDIYKIGPRDFVENKITLSEIADNITYIQLDNNIPIGRVFTLQIANYYMYLSIKDIGIVQFDRNGRFIRKIGSEGRGPGEYSIGMDFTVDEINGNVYVPDYGKAKVYSSSGIFRRDISYERYIGGNGMAGDIEVYNSLLFFPDYIINGDSKYNWIFLDTLGNLVAKKENSLPPFQANWGSNGSIYRFDDKLFYYNLFNDTIFSISPDLSSKAAYLFAQGDYRRPRIKIEITSISQLQSRFYKIFNPQTMFETKHFIVLQYTYLDRATFALIDKKTRKTFLAFKYEKIQGSLIKTKPYIINDLDGGMPLVNIKYYVDKGKEYITQIINPFDLKIYLSTDEFKNSAPEYPEKKIELEKLANRLKETDNPVLMMVRLKK